MAYTGRSGSFYLMRLIIGFAVCAVTLTVIGMIDVAKDAFGSGGMILTESMKKPPCILD